MLKGQPMYLTCELNKEREVVWKKDGNELKAVTGKIAINIIGLSHAVTIQSATEADAGIYTCECENLKTQTTVKVLGRYKTFLTRYHNVSIFYIITI